MVATVMETRVIRGARWKSAIMLAFSIVFLLGCIAMWRSPDGIAMPQIIVPGFTAMSIFGLVVSGAHTALPPRLTLSIDGFSQRSVYGELTRRWDQIEKFDMLRNNSVQTIVWKLKATAMVKRAWYVPFNRLLGYDEHLFGMWTVSPKALLSLMQGYHAAATKRAA